MAYQASVIDICDKFHKPVVVLDAYEVNVNVEAYSRSVLTSLADFDYGPDATYDRCKHGDYCIRCLKKIHVEG